MKGMPHRGHMITLQHLLLERKIEIKCDLISALPSAVQEFLNPLLAAVCDDLPPFCSVWDVLIPVSTA
jgi:hypothetical protein